MSLITIKTKKTETSYRVAFIFAKIIGIQLGVMKMEGISFSVALLILNLDIDITITMSDKLFP